jgi:glutamate dehydrogenase
MTPVRKAMDKHAGKLSSAAVPEPLAKRIATFNELYSALDIVSVSNVVGLDVEKVASVYFALGAKLDLHWMRDQVVALPRENRWQALARAALRDDLYDQEAKLSADVLRTDSQSDDADARIVAWLQANAVAVNRCRQVLSDLRTAGTPDFAMLSVAMREIRSLQQIEDANAASVSAQPSKRAGKKTKGRAA